MSVLETSPDRGTGETKYLWNFIAQISAQSKCVRRLRGFEKSKEFKELRSSASGRLFFAFFP